MSAPQRVVCLTEETTETIYLLGEQDRIVGISSFTLRPPEARKDKPVVSQFIKADLPAILAQEPDLILAFSDLQADICADLIRAGVEVYCLNHRSVAEIIAMVRTLSRLLDVADKGEALARRLEAKIESVRTLGHALPRRPRTYFEEWPDPIITGIKWVSELIEIAGGDDCFADKREMKLAKDRIVTAEDVIARQPEVYLASWCGKRFSAKEALARPGFAAQPFTSSERMLELPSSVILQPGPACILEGLDLLHEALAQVAGPDIWKNLDLRTME